VTYLILIAIGLSLVMAGAWAVQRMTGQSGWIDTIWSFGVGIAGISAVMAAGGSADRRIIAFILIAAWSIRLGTHIGSRTRLGGEDPRYAALVEQWGQAAARQLFLFLQIQALAAFVLVLGIYLAAANTAPYPRSLDLVAVVVAIVALAGETLADRQLSRFRASPDARTEVCEIGLWRYSRHPNYFFEWLFWCAWPLLAASGDSVWRWMALLAPALMYVLLVHISGIPPLEQHMLKSRGEKFRSLTQRVNAFFPGPRKGDVR
jgi:steroid 5-alpha reductase family enzyme